MGPASHRSPARSMDNRPSGVVRSHRRRSQCHADTANHRIDGRFDTRGRHAVGRGRRLLTSAKGTLRWVAAYLRIGHSHQQ